MKCAYCKKEICPVADANSEPDARTYMVEINGIECEVWVHNDCIPKLMSRYFSKPPVMYSTTDTIPLNDLKTGDKPWTIMTPTWNAGGTLKVEEPSRTRVWCKTNDDDGYRSWRDRVD